MEKSQQEYVYRPPSWFQAVQVRSRRAKYDVFGKIMPLSPSTRILDLGSGGGTFLERMHPWPESIVALDINEAAIAQLRDAHPKVTGVVGDATALPFPDGFFDIVFCNAVMEHIPDEIRQRMCAEIRRVARHYFVSVPNRRFFLEPHSKVPFLHWLPHAEFKQAMSVLIRLGMVDLSYDYHFGFLTARDMRRLFPEAKITTLCCGAHIIATL